MGKSVPALEKAISILRLLASQPDQPKGLTELVEASGMSPSTCHSIVMVLCDNGFLVRHPRRKTYALGPAILELGNLAAEQYLGLPVARDVVAETARQLQLSAVIGARDEDEMTVVFHHEADWGLGAARTGFRSPMVPPLGLIFVAWDTELEVEQWLARSGYRPESPEWMRLSSTIDKVRSDGYWVSLSGSMHDITMSMAARLAHESDPEARLKLAVDLLNAIDSGPAMMAPPMRGGDRFEDMLGAPVFGPDGRVTLTITAVGAPGQIQAKGVEKVARAVTTAAKTVTQAIGGKPPARRPRLADARN